MNVSVGEKADEMKLAIVLFHKADRSVPGCGFEDRAALDGFVDELGTLGIDLSASQRIMPDFRVAHVVVARKADCRAACLDCGVRPFGHQFFDLGFICVQYRISHIFFCPADTIHNYQYYRFSHNDYSSPFLLISL